MVLSIEIDLETQERLRREAERNGVDPAEYARRLIQAALPPSGPVNSLRELFAAWDGEDATDDPAVLERRRAEWDEVKAGLDAARTPPQRKLFP